MGHWPKNSAGLSYTNKVERRRIHRFVYQGSRHVDLDAIEAEAAELMEKDKGSLASEIENLQEQLKTTRKLSDDTAKQR